MYEIRKYDKKDKDQVIKLWIDICVQEHGFKEWEDEFQDIVLEDYEEIIVAIYNNQVVGTIAYRQKGVGMVELKRVYVDKEHRGNGVAKKLLDEVIRLVKEKDYKKILIETWDKFKSGIRFYEKNNFMLQSIQDEVYNYILEL